VQRALFLVCHDAGCSSRFTHWAVPTLFRPFLLLFSSLPLFIVVVVLSCVALLSFAHYSITFITSDHSHSLSTIDSRLPPISTIISYHIARLRLRCQSRCIVSEARLLYPIGQVSAHNVVSPSISETFPWNINQTHCCNSRQGRAISQSDHLHEAPRLHRGIRHRAATACLCHRCET